MKINTANLTNCYNIQPNFKSYGKVVYAKDGKLQYKTSTYPFRDDVDWNKFAELLNEKYRDIEKVHIINHACSIGTEPLCLAVKLITILGEKSDKFFPIIAKDIDEENIEIAKSYKIIDDMYGLKSMKNELGNNFDKFFYSKDLTTRPYNRYSKKTEIIPCSILKEKIYYERSDIFDDIDRIPGSNTVILCRNFWPYLAGEQQERLAKKIAGNFDNTCLIVIGDFDTTNNRNCNIQNVFRKNGLKETSIKNVWCKID